MLTANGANTEEIKKFQRIVQLNMNCTERYWIFKILEI